MLELIGNGHCLASRLLFDALPIGGIFRIELYWNDIRKFDASYIGRITLAVLGQGIA